MTRFIDIKRWSRASSSYYGKPASEYGLEYTPNLTFLDLWLFSFSNSCLFADEILYWIIGFFKLIFNSLRNESLQFQIELIVSLMEYILFALNHYFLFRKSLRGRIHSWLTIFDILICASAVALLANEWKKIAQQKIFFEISVSVQNISFNKSF